MQNLLMIIEKKMKYKTLIDLVLPNYYSLYIAISFNEALPFLQANKYDHIMLDLEYLALYSGNKIEENVPEFLITKSKEDREIIGRYILEHHIRNKDEVENNLNINTQVTLCVDSINRAKSREQEFKNMGATNIIYLPQEIKPFLDIFKIDIETLGAYQKRV